MSHLLHKRVYTTNAAVVVCTGDRPPCLVLCFLEDACEPKRVVTVSVCVSVELNPAFFPGAPDVWPPHPLAYTAELPGAAAAAAAGLQHHPALFPALHAQVPVRSYL